MYQINIYNFNPLGLNIIRCLYFEFFFLGRSRQSEKAITIQLFKKLILVMTGIAVFNIKRMFQRQTMLTFKSTYEGVMIQNKKTKQQIVNTL